MEKITNAINKWLMSISSKLASNKYLNLLMNSFLNCIPFIVIGAFCLILSKSPISPDKLEPGTFLFDFFTAWDAFCKAYLPTLSLVNQFTMGSLAFMLSIALGYNYSKEEDLHPVHSVLVATVSFLLVNSKIVDGTISKAYFGGEGMFTAIIAVFLGLIVFNKFAKKGITFIKLPDTVPGNLKQSINNLLPMFFTFAIMAAFSGIFVVGFGKTFPEAFAGIANFIQFGFDNVIGACIYFGLSTVSWWFGIHDTAGLSLLSPVMYANLASNAEAVAAGLPIPHIVSLGFKSFVAIGGSGGTLGLVLLMLRSKSQEVKAIGKLSIVPAMFGINEPVIFGLPIMLNPLFFLPFFGCAIVQTIISYTVFSLGWVNTPAFYLGGTSPEILKQFFATTDWRAIILWAALILVQMIIWKPFLSIHEKQKIAEENGKTSA